MPLRKSVALDKVAHDGPIVRKVVQSDRVPLNAALILESSAHPPYLKQLTDRTYIAHADETSVEQKVVRVDGTPTRDEFLVHGGLYAAAHNMIVNPFDKDEERLLSGGNLRVRELGVDTLCFWHEK